MKKISYTIKLLSDAEPGSGLGNEIVNDVVSRNHDGIPVIRAAHLKGLLRQQIKDIGAAHAWAEKLAVLCFGRGGANGDDGVESMIRMCDALSENKEVVRTITRTRLNEAGTVAGGSLRTTEAVKAGTKFNGCVMIDENAPEAVELAVRMALLSLAAVGGGRTRGSGACVVKMADETRLPGELLRALHTVAGSLPEPCESRDVAQDAVQEPEGAAVMLRLVFEADDPVCCPDSPVTSGNNVIQSGLGIPASAVQGMVITRLNGVDNELATATFADSRTRAWPLLPLPEKYCDEHTLPVRVSLSHRMSKLPDEQKGAHFFEDVAIKSYDWRKVAKGSPLKGSDGVLFRASDKQQSVLWKSGDIPRVLTSHSVHHEAGEDDDGKQRRRNLFTVEAQAPMTYVGLVSLPPGAAKAFMEAISNDPHATFGKARSVRGGGTLRVEKIKPEQMPKGCAEEKVFVLQSPAVFPHGADSSEKPVEDLLGELVQASGWGELAAPQREAGQILVDTQAACGVRFGWNRHSGKSGVRDTNRLQGCKVFLPGTVFVLKDKPTNLHELLVKGLGEGREQGYGAVLPHPGVAAEAYHPKVKYMPIVSRDKAGKIALEWFKDAKKSGLSPSQVAAVAERIHEADGEQALDFLEKQKLNRAGRIWDRWKPIYAEVNENIKKKPVQAKRALRVLQDMLIAEKSKESENGRSK